MRCIVQNRITITGVAQVAFTSRDSISLLFSTGRLGSLKITDAYLVEPRKDMSQRKLSETGQVKKCILSHNGELIAIYESCEVLLINEVKLLFSSRCLFKVNDECEHTVSCLTFSADDSWLLFCIEKSNRDQFFYLWNVVHSFLTGPYSTPFPYEMHLTAVVFPLPIAANCFSVMLLPF